MFFENYDKSIISVDKNGNVKALKNGNTTIHVYGKVDKNINVYVTNHITQLPSVDNLNIKEELKEFKKELFDENKIKVGDLLHAEEGTGHIGMIIGIDDENYYVAQSIWFDQEGIVVSTYSKDDISNDWWTHVVLMDDYYKNDGNLTKMWY